jgi:hypothetical protein
VVTSAAASRSVRATERLVSLQALQEAAAETMVGQQAHLG